MRITSHFNELTEAQQERLVILMEECNEVAQIACKILRHGYESYDPNDVSRVSNRKLLETEIGHVRVAIDGMTESSDVFMPAVMDSMAAKRVSIRKYLHHQHA